MSNRFSFKVGNRVRVIASNEELKEYGCDAEVGKEYTIGMVGGINLNVEGVNWIRLEHIEISGAITIGGDVYVPYEEYKDEVININGVDYIEKED